MGIFREFFAFRVGTKAAWEQPLDDNGYQQFRKYLHETYVKDPTLRTVTTFSPSKMDDQCVTTDLFELQSSSRKLLEAERALLCEWQNFKSSSDYRRQIPNILVPPGEATEDNLLSLAVHGSVDRLDRLVDGIQRWKGPASVAIYANNATAIGTFFGYLRREGNLLASVTFHFFFEKVVRERDHLYPHNYLRNLALEFSNAEYVISCDMDFVTHQDAHAQLVKLLSHERDVRVLLDKQTALVLPAFESGPSVVSESFMPPVDKASLVRQVSEKLVEPFHVRKYSAGHGPTNFTEWLNHDETRRAATYEIPYAWGFEPYVLAKRLDLPKFWTPFRGFGFNKQSWYEELDRRGYQFSVLRDFFIFHVGASSGRVETPDWVHKEYHRKFLPYLDRHYPKVT
jgi:glycosyltransferase-like protein LARGE